MFPFRNKRINIDTHIVTIGTRKYILFSHQIVCLDN